MLSYATSSLVFEILRVSVVTVTYIMRLLAKIVYLFIGILCVCAQNDGRYRPVSRFSTTKKPVAINDGRYRPVNDGRYRPANDGRYRPDDDGKYTHIGDKDRGLYTGGGGEYTGGGGQYTGSNSNGGQYNGNGGDYNGGLFGQTNTGIGIKTTVRPNPKTGPPTAKPNPKTSPPTAKPTPNSLSTGNKDGWKIIRYEMTEDTDGYHYLYETENGILAEEAGKIENLAPNEDGLRSKGFYQYTGDDGVLYRVDYVADNNGFVPQGDHIPKTPPAIQKLLDYLASQS